MAEMRSYNPSLRDKIAWAIAGKAGDWFGAGRHTQQDIAGKVGGLIDFVPGVGDAVGLDEAARDYSAGNYGLAAAGLGLTAVGAVPGIGDAISGAARKGIKAFHGSPHSFDKFSVDKIGTGEGAQAYGHGLYFAESEDVAQSYRQALQQVDTAPFDEIGVPPGQWNAARMFAQNMDPTAPDAAARDFAQWTGRDVTPELVEAFRRAKRPGHTYEVSINADPADFLDWDAPLSAQSEKVQDAYQRFSAANPEYVDPKVAGGQYENPTGKDFLGAYGEWVPHDNNDMFNYRRKFTDDLSEAGIPGIRYLDQGSRSAGGTRNYVVFDDSIVNIVRKYGLAGAVSAGLITQQVADQMAAQGISESGI